MKILFVGERVEQRAAAPQTVVIVFSGSSLIRIFTSPEATR